MFDTGSRYATLPTATLEQVDSDGSTRLVVYATRRLIPTGTGPALVVHRFAAGERLDTITAAYFGDPTRFWQICDANEILRPEEFTAEVGNPFVVPLPVA